VTATDLSMNAVEHKYDFEFKHSVHSAI